MNFEYFYDLVPQKLIEIDDIANVCLEGKDLSGNFCYLLISCKNGFVHILQYGPDNPDFNNSPSEVYCSYSRIDFSERKLTKIIDSFVNMKNMDEVREITIEEALKNIRNMGKMWDEQRIY